MHTKVLSITTAIVSLCEGTCALLSYAALDRFLDGPICLNTSMVRPVLHADMYGLKLACSLPTSSCKDVALKVLL